MSRKSLISLLATFLLVPAVVYAGLNVATVVTGLASGTITPKGGYVATAKTYTLRPNLAGGYDRTPVVTNNGVAGTVTNNGGLNPSFAKYSTYSYRAPLQGTTQNINISFTKSPSAAIPALKAVLPTSPISVPLSTLVTLSGQTSTVLYLAGNTATLTWLQTGGPVSGVLTFTTPTAQITNAHQVSTTASANLAGTYTARMSLKFGGYSSYAFAYIAAQGPGVVASNYCLSCHQGWTEAVSYANSIHANQAISACQGCHSVGTHPAAPQCATCHVTVASASLANTVCAGCHSRPNTGDAAGTSTGDVHTLNTEAPAPYTNFKCIDCHSVAIAHPVNPSAPLVSDNNGGVRAITTEFAKWSHHVTGVDLNDAHCAACHLEGKVSGNAIIVDTTKHMADAKTHLRHADADTDYVWDPALPNHTNMDNFCMSCHDADGATSTASQAIQALINTVGGAYNTGKTASASNPFGDTISNRYDKMLRPAVVNVDSQFDVGNNSHHGVKAAKYTGRTRNLAGPRTIASPSTFKGASSATLFGVRSTMYDAGNLNALYSPLGTDGSAAQGLGDDSTLHCGDCHTVGQWKPLSSETANGSPTPVAIGAHGSNNEYLLRNTTGTDARHTQNAFVINPATGVATYTNPSGAFLVCYNCHTYTKYGSIFLQTGVFGGHVGEYDATGRCNGVGNTIPFNGYTTGAATDGTQFKTRFGNSVGTPATSTAGAPTALMWTTAAPYAGEQIADFGNVFGIQCANCHNSGSGNAYGGIHGSANNQTLEGFINDPSISGGSYIDGAQNTTKIIRFLPGLGDASHVPGTLGGITNGTPATFLKYSANIAKTVYTSLPVRSALNAAIGTVGTGKLGSIPFVTGGVTNDTNWEQKHWQQTTQTYVTTAGAYNNAAAVGAGCYTLGNAAEKSVGWPEAQTGKLDQSGNVIAVRPATNEDLRGPSQGVVGEPNPLLFDNWGGCDDHGAPVGGGNHGFIKRIVRPVTY